MKNFIIAIMLLTCFMGSQNVYSQFASTAIPLLKTSPCPIEWGMGASNISIPYDSPFSHFFNPSLLSAKKQSNYFSIGSITRPDDFMYYSFEVTSYALAAGHDLGKIGDIKFSGGIGFLYYKVDLGEFTRTYENGEVGGKFSAYESSNQYSIAISAEYYAKLSLGIGLKDLTSALAPVSSLSSGINAKVKALDIGLLLQVPLINNYSIIDNITADASVNAAYSIVNLGDEMTYLNVSDPLPRIATLGYSVETSIEYLMDDIAFNILSFDFSASAKDLLIIRNTFDYEYKGIFGDINVFDNLFALNQEGSVIPAYGINIGLFDTFNYMFGKNYEQYTMYDELYFKTNGYKIQTRGIFNLADYITDNEIIEYIAKHFNVVYVDSERTRNYKGNDVSNRNGALYIVFSNFEVF